MQRHGMRVPALELSVRLAQVTRPVEHEAAMTARQSAASAAREFFDGMDDSVFGRTDRLAALLESREAGLSGQVAALREALKAAERDILAMVEVVSNLHENDFDIRQIRNALASTADAAREFEQRVLAEEREACAKIADAEPESVGPMPPDMEALSLEVGPEISVRAAVRATKVSIAAKLRARTEP